VLKTIRFFSSIVLYVTLKALIVEDPWAGRDRHRALEFETNPFATVVGDVDRACHPRCGGGA
jgi:hypothetical protein